MIFDVRIWTQSKQWMNLRVSHKDQILIYYDFMNFRPLFRRTPSHSKRTHIFTAKYGKCHSPEWLAPVLFRWFGLPLVLTLASMWLIFIDVLLIAWNNLMFDAATGLCSRVNDVAGLTCEDEKLHSHEQPSHLWIVNGTKWTFYRTNRGRGSGEIIRR